MAGADSGVPERLSPEQMRALDPAVRVIEAGPGSGKTHTVVTRYMRAASAGDGGVALISFTNAAVDEARRRACRVPHLLRPPHFVGTIDAFLHRYVVTPRAIGTLGRMPSYLASWDDLPEHHARKRVRVKDIAGAGIALSKFIPRDRAVVLLEESLDRYEEKYLADVTDAGQRDGLVALARDSIRDYAKGGIYDSSVARAMAAHVIAGSQGPTVLRRLARRFRLILVDEAQDCDEHEFGVLAKLGDHTSVVLVADPDQAIFEFRGGKPELFIGHRDACADHECASLSTCYRSSAAICTLVDALRAAGRARIEAANNGPCPPILVLTGPKAQQGAKFLDALDQFAVDPAGAIVLAHGRALARAVAGAPPSLSTRAAANRLAHARTVTTTPAANYQERLAAIRDVEAVLLELIAWKRDDLRTASRAAQLEQIGRDAAWLRKTAGALLRELAGLDDPKTFGEKARAAIAVAYEDSGIAHAALHARVKRPDAGLLATDHHGTRLAHDTIHGRKGQEFDAVLLALPRRRASEDVLDDWARDLNTEARRVMYVGASRAKRILAIGVETARAAEVCKLLDAHHVPYERRSRILGASLRQLALRPRCSAARAKAARPATSNP